MAPEPADDVEMQCAETMPEPSTFEIDSVSVWRHSERTWLTTCLLRLRTRFCVGAGNTLGKIFLACGALKIVCHTMGLQSRLHPIPN